MAGSTDLTRHRRGARRTIAIAICLAIALLPGCAGPGSRAPSEAGTADEAASPPLATARVGRGDLTTVQQHDGQLGFGETLPVVAGRAGTVTALPTPGGVVTRDEPLVEIDGIPTRLLHGTRPAWRPLAVSQLAAHDGADILQLNDNLAALGYAPREELPGERFDWRTRDAVRRWQTDLGRPATGELELGDVAFLPGDVRISTVEVRPGTWVQAGDVLLAVTGTEQVVTLALPARDRSTIDEGLAVHVVLPDGSKLEGTVRSIGQVATAAEDGARPTVAVEVALAEPVAGARGLDAAPVQVQVRRVVAADVLTVPVGALIAAAGGGYAVERVTAGGIERIPVEPGEFADGLVAVAGEVAEGDLVVVPS